MSRQRLTKLPILRDPTLDTLGNLLRGPSLACGSKGGEGGGGKQSMRKHALGFVVVRETKTNQP